MQVFFIKLRNTIRSLRRSPAYTVSAILTIAVCIGPNAAIFSLFHKIALKNLPFPRSAELIRISNVFERLGGTRSGQESSIAQFLDFEAHAALFSGFSAAQEIKSAIGWPNEATIALGQRVNAEFFKTLRVSPILGRFPDVSEQISGRDKVIVISERWWRGRFDTRIGVLGETLTVDGEKMTIIGVAPGSLDEMGLECDFFKPMAILPDERNPDARYVGTTSLIGRLKEGASAQSAGAELQSLETAYHESAANPKIKSFLTETGQHISTEIARPKAYYLYSGQLWMVQVSALCILALCFVNITNLVLARSRHRFNELSTRFALGASPRQLVWQLLIENATLAIAGGVLGIFLSAIAIGVARLQLTQLVRWNLDLQVGIAGYLFVVVTIVLPRIGYDSYIMSLLLEGFLGRDEQNAFGFANEPDIRESRFCSCTSCGCVCDVGDFNGFVTQLHSGNEDTSWFRGR